MASSSCRNSASLTPPHRPSAPVEVDGERNALRAQGTCGRGTSYSGPIGRISYSHAASFEKPFKGSCGSAAERVPEESEKAESHFDTQFALPSLISPNPTQPRCTSSGP